MTHVRPVFWLLLFLLGGLAVPAMSQNLKRPQTNITGLLISLGSEPMTFMGIKVDETNTLIIHPAFQKQVKKLPQTTYQWRGYLYTGVELLDASTSASLKKANALILSNQVYFIPLKWKKIQATQGK